MSTHSLQDPRPDQDSDTIVVKVPLNHPIAPRATAPMSAPTPAPMSEWMLVGSSQPILGARSRKSNNGSALVVREGHTGEANVDVDAPQNLRKRERSDSFQLEHRSEERERSHRRIIRQSNNVARESSINTGLSNRATSTRATKLTSATTTASSRKPSLSHFILRDEADARIFADQMNRVGNLPNQTNMLEIHLDASRSTELSDFFLAVALQTLHPRPDGTNPHQLRAIRLVVSGDVLYMRYSFHLASPAFSKDVSKELKSLATTSLSIERQVRLTYKINSSEGSVARALLAIRGLGEVTISGKGKMEVGFAELLKRTIIQPPRTEVHIPRVGIFPHSTPKVSRDGVFESTAYERKVDSPISAVAPSPFVLYPTRTATSERDFSTVDKMCTMPEDTEGTVTSRYLVEERIQLLQHFLGQPEVCISTQAVANDYAKLVTKDFIVDNDKAAEAVRTGNHKLAKKGQLTMDDMVVIKTGEENWIRSGGLSEKTWGTGTVELGWKV